MGPEVEKSLAYGQKLGVGRVPPERREKGVKKDNWRPTLKGYMEELET